jgi:hypothetical protein
MTLRLTLEIVPFGDEDKKRTIEVVNISNLGWADEGADYKYLIEHNKYKARDPESPTVSHLRADGAMVLARKALEVLTKD